MKKWIPLLAVLAFATPLYAQPVTPPAVEAGTMAAERMGGLLATVVGRL